MSRAKQPGWHPSIRRVTTPTGRAVVLSVPASKRRGESATYSGHHRMTGDRLSIRKSDGRWEVRAWATGENVKYAGGRPGWVLLSQEPTLSAAAEWAK